MWFKDKKRMEFIQSYIPTSKAQLLKVAMWYHKGNVEKAQEMVDFYTRNMNLPDYDPMQPTFMQQMKSTFTDFYNFVKENQSDLVQGYQFIQNIIKNRGDIMPDIHGEALPPINE